MDRVLVDITGPGKDLPELVGGSNCGSGQQFLGEPPWRLTACFLNPAVVLRAHSYGSFAANEFEDLARRQLQ